MSKLSKAEVLKLITSQIQGLVFIDRIPDRKGLNENQLAKIASSFGRKMVTPAIVGEVAADFSFDEVLNKAKSGDPRAKGGRKFADLPNVNVAEVTDRVYKFISGLPKEYCFVFKFPKASKEFQKVKFTHGVELFVIDDKTIKDYVGERTERGGLEALLSDYGRDQPGLSKGDVILRIDGKGYIGRYGIIKINIVDPLYTFKVILGVYIALGVIHRKKKIDYLRLLSEYRYDVYDTDKNLVRTLAESTEDAQYLHRMEFNPEKFKLSDLDELVKKKTTGFKDANQIIANLLKKIKFAKGKTDKMVIKRQRVVKNGAYWYYESVKTTQDHLRAIYLTTAFDSLLAAKGKENTREHKAEMISNTIAKNILEADVVYRGIIRLYELRNKIVHGEKPISALEQYGDIKESASQSIVIVGLWYLSRFLFNRIHFITSGLSIVVGKTSKRSR